MAQIKMKYGIDLGTTNSAICKMENGETVIKKTDTLKDTLPSCVSFTKKKITKVGDGAYNDLRQDKARATKKWTKLDENVFIEFKRTMGLDTSYCSKHMEKSFSSEELSAEVLKTLKSFVTEENIDSCVITVPAKFKTDQIAATKRAAEMAGINHCELLQEPIAASMAYGLNTNKKNGLWLVFDFGGGTFDAALIKVEEGILQVKDTEGDNYLGGKNLDMAIVDKIIIPYLKENFVIDEILEDEKRIEILRNAMKFYAEQAKNQLSFKDKCDITSQLDEFGEDDEGNEIELDMIVNSEQLPEVLSPFFQKAINICKDLLRRNNLSGTDLDSLILVGGPTYSPILRDMLKEQITPNIDTSIDPMTAVARGAALYASSIDTEVKGYEVVSDSNSATIALDLAYESSSVEQSEFVSAKLLREECTGYVPNKVYIEFVRNDKAWSSGKIEINEIGDVIECHLLEGRSNAFSIIAYDDKGNTIPCFPNEINILQGIVVGNAILPYNIGIEAYDMKKDQDVFVPIKGLEKNQPIPSTGVINGLKTPNQIRPGIETDRLVIPIYQGEYNTAGTSAIYNDHVTDIIINGDDVPGLIPENSDLDITVKVDRSQMMIVEVNFPVIGDSIEKKIDIKQRQGVDAEELLQRFNEAKRKLRAIKAAPSISEDETEETETILSDVTNRFDSEKSSEDGKMHLLADLRRAFTKMEEVERSHEWETLEAELREEFDNLEKANNELGNEHDNEVEALRKQTDVVIRQHDVALGKQLLEEINSVFVKVTLIYQLIGFIRHYSASFTQNQWKDATRARQLLNQGLEIINDNPTVRTLHPLVVSVIDLLDIPTNEKPRF